MLIIKNFISKSKLLIAFSMALIFLFSSYNVNAKETNIVNKKTSMTNTTTQISGLKIQFINVGQGDGILIQQGSHSMVIDAGTTESTKTFINYLKSNNIKNIDYVIGTHPHEDHIGGLDDVIKNFNVKTVYMPKITSSTKAFSNLTSAIKSKGLKITTPVVGSSFNLGNAKCTILAPNSGKYADLNNYSIVIKIQYGKNKFLFAGDAESLSESQILSKGLDVSADVIKIGHHGSNSSTSQKFLSKVNPKFAVISVGKGNKYGHPMKSTMDKLKKAGIKTYRTDECGTIILTSNGTNISFNTKQGDYSYRSKA